MSVAIHEVLSDDPEEWWVKKKPEGQTPFGAPVSFTIASFAIEATPGRVYNDEADLTLPDAIHVTCSGEPNEEADPTCGRLTFTVQLTPRLPTANPKVAAEADVAVLSPVDPSGDPLRAVALALQNGLQQHYLDYHALGELPGAG